MNLRSKVLIVTGGGIVLIAVLLIVAYPLFRSAPDENQALNDLPELISPSTLTPLPPDTIVNNGDSSQQTRQFPADSSAETGLSMEENSQRAEIERVSRLFAERFGSYSNYSNFSNLDSLSSFSTPSMINYINTTVRAEQGANQGGSYYGVTTRVIRAVIDSYQPQVSASVNISVQQEVQNGIQASIERSIHDGRVDLLYQNGKWLVNGIFYSN